MQMRVLVKNILKCSAEFDIKAHLGTFELLKEKTIVDYRNRRFQQAYVHAITANNAFQVRHHCQHCLARATSAFCCCCCCCLWC